MKDTIYLVANSRGIDRMLKSKVPRLRGGEVAVAVTVSIDEEQFRTPLVHASLEVDGSYLIEPTADVEITEPPSDKEESDV